jgi:EthD domain-containing protein
MSEQAAKSRKVMSLVACEAGRDRTAFRDRFLHHHAELMLLHCPRMRRYVVNLVDVKAKVVFRGRTTPPHRELDPPPFDIVTEMWLDSFDDFKDPARLYSTPAAEELICDDLKAMGGRCYDYLISPVTQWDRVSPTTPGERTPGVKAMFISRRYENLDIKAAEKAWREHRVAAEKYHNYATRYVQNGVIAALTPDAPVWHGCAELFYPTLEDLEQRFVGGTEEGEVEIAKDAARFVADSYPLFTSEYVLRG